MQIKQECVNCTKSQYCGKDGVGNILFGCSNPICIFEQIVENPFRTKMIEGYKNGGKNT